MAALNFEQLFNNQSEADFVRLAVSNGHSESDARSWYGLKVNSMRGGGRNNEKLSYTGITEASKSISATLKSEISRSNISELNSDDNIDVNKYLSAIKMGGGPLTLLAELGGDILRQIQNEEQVRTDINETLGITDALSKSVRDTITESTTNALRFGFGMKEVSTMFTSMSEVTGKANFMSTETANKSFAVARSFVGTLGEVGKLLAEAEKIGLGASDTLDAIEKAGRSSLGLGLNTKKTTELLKTDLSKLNEYGFKNGIEGLNRMVQKSLEFRMNLGEVYKIADKVMNPDSAIELTANLQVLGGAIGDFNDPLKLMYMATNNVEGLQDALIGAAGNLATYNQEQGRFEITGVNLRRAKEMAAQLGIEYKEFAKGAIAAQERLTVVQDLAGKGFNLSDKDTEFISNLSQMKDGKMVLSIPKDVSKELGIATETAISDLTQNQIQLLKDNQDKLDKMSTEDIAREQFSAVKNIQNDVNAMANRTIRTLSPTVREIAETSESQTLIKNMARDAARNAVLNTTGESQMNEALNGVRDFVKGFANSIGINNLSQELIRQVDDIINKTKQEDRDRIRKFEEEKQKRELKTRPGEETSFNRNGIIKTNIGISFDNMSALFPQVEQKGSYMIPDVMA